MIRQPGERLSDWERLLAERLPRLHGRSEPDPGLDARILGAARAAVASPCALRPRIRWIAPMAVAASLSLAVGLAWRLQPPAAGIARPPMAEAVSTDLPQARAIAMPADQAQASKAVASLPAAPPEQLRPATPRALAGTAAMPHAAAAAPPAPAPPAPPAASPVASAQRAAAGDMVAAPTVTPLSSQGMAKAVRTDEGSRESVPAPAAAAPRPQANQAAVAANAAADDPSPFLSDDPGEEVPPATADSPEVRDAWLQRIGELLQQGRSEDAKASLAEFRRRYPTAPLPPDLRVLEP